ncbi:Rho GTPase-activating protein 27 [Hondaea fermentalgiana]|uniref:Rho GTPase-activating protein 27 n=1 Tax=Hondaea fermentalgiana TaxID=2315210 RepID=A0A2R5GE54_9STRA|nr:Rho GTPase-activating protein 27 [Hondaea fermentalgiana]|eukprot:GBG26501.1 Rho GTPase-activating protein 27 [Hondaea fermentalgiana]
MMDAKVAGAIANDKEGDVIVDRAGDRWVAKVDADTGVLFYYNEKSWESRNERPLTTESVADIAAALPARKPEYATDWSDPKYPDWIQYIEFQSKRAYYHNTATGETTWAPPDQPDLDVFKKEIEDSQQTLMTVPDSVPSAAPGRRFLAGIVDAGASFAAGCAFGTLVYLDIGNLMGAGASVSLSAWTFFVCRDMIFERGTRSPGKRLLKLEIVRTDGQLPSRWNTLFRQIYLPVYLGSAFLMPYIFVFSAADLGAMLFTAKRQRLGDFIAQTRVIDEQPDRQVRLDEKARVDDEDDAKE